MNNLFLAYLIIGIAIVLCYATFQRRGISMNQLWTNNYRNHISYKLKPVYILMMILATISTLVIITYTTIIPNNQQYSDLFTAGTYILLIFSLIWGLFPFIYTKFVLLMVSIGALLIFSEFLNKNDKMLAAFSGILFIHTFIFDFLIYNYF